MNPLPEPSKSRAGINNNRPHIVNPPLEPTNNIAVTNSMFNVRQLIKQIKQKTRL